MAFSSSMLAAPAYTLSLTHALSLSLSLSVTHRNNRRACRCTRRLTKRIKRPRRKQHKLYSWLNKLAYRCESCHAPSQLIPFAMLRVPSQYVMLHSIAIARPIAMRHVSEKCEAPMNVARDMWMRHVCWHCWCRHQESFWCQVWSWGCRISWHAATHFISWHAATHCISWHAATHCNTLKHIAGDGSQVWRRLSLRAWGVHVCVWTHGPPNAPAAFSLCLALCSSFVSTSSFYASFSLSLSLSHTHTLFLYCPIDVCLHFRCALSACICIYMYLHTNICPVTHMHRHNIMCTV